MFRDLFKFNDTVGQAPCNKLIKDDAKGVQVGLIRDIFGTFFLLGAHVGRCADKECAPIGLVGVGDECDAKVNHFYYATFSDQDIFRLEVAVDDAVGVEMAEGMADALDNLKDALLT